MATTTKFGGTITQTTGGKYCTFNNLANINRGGEGVWATSNGRIKGKNSSPNRPSTISCTNYNFNLPTGAEPTKVTITYRYRKEKYNGNVCNIQAPTITLLGVTGYTGKGAAPTTTMKTYTKSWSTSNLTRSQINSSSFGVKIDFPTNSNSYEGTMTISAVQVTVEYKVHSYSLQLKKASGGYNEDPYVLEASISNKNFTSYNPTLTLSAPAGFSFTNGSGTGTFVRVNNRTVTWNPKLSSKVGTSTCRFTFDTNVTFPSTVDSYTGTFTLVESLNSTTKNYTAVVEHRPPSTGSETAPSLDPVIDGETVKDVEPISAVVDDEIPITVTGLTVMFTFPADNSGEALYNEEDTPVSYYLHTSEWQDGTVYDDGDYVEPVEYLNDVPEKVKFTAPGKYVLLCYDGVASSDALGAPFNTGYSDYEDLTVKAKVYFDIKPEELSLGVPNFTILEPSTEEVDRLGDGYAYIVQSYIKNTTTDSYTRNWYKNNRIGVYNADDNDEELTDEQIYEGATYWATNTAGLNTYNSVECEFTYNEEYPLYIVLTGDYAQAGYDDGEITFTQPCIIEKTIYNGWEATGNYPVPIMALIDPDEADSATLTLEGYETADNIRLYDLPLDDGYGTNDSLAVRGIQIRGTVESTDSLVLYAKLYSPNGSMGQRSIVLTPTIDGQDFVIGGLGDLWGFSTADLKDLEDWEIELSASNTLSGTSSTLNSKGIEIVFYMERVEHQEVSVIVEGEDLAYYGAFIENVTIPEGLETDTSYINIDGTDMNDAYRQNIKEKTITIDFNISECDLKTSTDMLRQLTKLLVNEKDQYNRPIPKRVQFSYYPEDYFEYIMESPLTISNEVSGYNCKATLTIPAGTSYSLDDTITNTVGTVQGLAAINPTITIQPSSTNIQINETLTGQTFNMGYTGDWNDNTVEIDCNNRKVYLITDDNKVDISKYVDHNSDWFRLYGEYSFEGVNCIIRTVSYNERW